MWATGPNSYRSHLNSFPRLDPLSVRGAPRMFPCFLIEPPLGMPSTKSQTPGTQVVLTTHETHTPSGHADQHSLLSSRAAFCVGSVSQADFQLEDLSPLPGLAPSVIVALVCQCPGTDARNQENCDRASILPHNAVDPVLGAFEMTNTGTCLTQ